MNVLMSIWTFFANNFLKTPAYFIGLITIVGYILLKKKWYDVFSGFIKATVGYKILLVGSGGLSSTFKPIISALSSKFGIDALVLDTYVGQVAAQSAIETVGKSFCIFRMNKAGMKLASVPAILFNNAISTIFSTTSIS